MFSQNNEESKLDWMYKGANSLVDREEYLLGRTIDKTLEQLNVDDRQKATNQLPQPKNHVEHECIPPSIRDYNKITLADQVDLAAKLQEDPLVTIRKREEETRKQFLQNPIQLKKLQKALQSQQKEDKKKKKKSKKSKHKKSDKDIDAKLIEKLNQLKNNPLGLGVSVSSKKSDRDGDLDDGLIHKFNKLKQKLTENDIKSILEGKETSSEDDTTSSDDEPRRRRGNNFKDDEIRNKRNCNEHRRSFSRSLDEEERNDKKFRHTTQDNRYNRLRQEERYNHRRDDRYRKDAENEYKSRREVYRNEKPYYRRNEERRNHNNSGNYSSLSDDERAKKNWGLVTHDGKKISLNKDKVNTKEMKPETSKTETSSYTKTRVKLSEEEREKRRREMMENAAWRDKEREMNVKKYREEDSKEFKQTDYDPEFIHNQMAKATSGSSVESRIKSNLNNIQRSSTHMDRNFSRRN